jgi:hypothetical protein
MARDNLVSRETFLSRRFGSARAAWLQLRRRMLSRQLDRLTA